MDLYPLYLVFCLRLARFKNFFSLAISGFIVSYNAVLTSTAGSASKRSLVVPGTAHVLKDEFIIVTRAIIMSKPLTRPEGERPDGRVPPMHGATYRNRVR